MCQVGADRHPQAKNPAEAGFVRSLAWGEACNARPEGLRFTSWRDGIADYLAMQRRYLAETKVKAGP